MIPLTWKQVETRSDSDFVVAPDQRLSWVRTIGIGAQHVVAMFGATFLVPIGHVKSVGQMTATEVDPMIGRALAADGVATTLAGFGGGSATTTYAENIGVMAATRVYSTAAYWIAAAVAIALSLCPKVGAAISAIPPGVLGGATIVLYGLVGVLGVRIWLTNHVDFSKPLNQMTAAIPLIIGIADFTWQAGDLTFTGIALGSIAALLVYHGMRSLGRLRGGQPRETTRTGTGTGEVVG